MNNKNKFIKIVIPMIAMIAIIGISYSLFSEVITGERKYVITSNNLKVETGISPTNLPDWPFIAKW